MHPLRALAISLCLILPSLPATAAPSSEAVNKLTSYAVILGRAAVCVSAGERNPVAARVGKWIDHTFHGEDRVAYLVIFMQGMEMNARAQSDGSSPDTCEAVVKEFRLVPWPK